MSDFLVISPSLTPHQPQSFSCFSCNWPGIFPLETFAFILAFAWDPLPPDSPVARPPSPPPRLGVNVTLSMRSTLTDRVSPSPSNFPSPSLSPHRVLLWGWNLIPSIMLYNFFFFCFLWSHLQHMEVPGVGVELELQLPDYITVIVTPDLSSICGNSGSLTHWVRPGIEPPSSQILYCILNLLEPQWELLRNLCICCVYYLSLLSWT